MILRRVTLERYGCFGSTEFEFRRGLNLISGGNETGKSLLLSALPAAMLGVEHGTRLRSWGDTLNCRVTLLFEGADRRVRLARDLENNLVRLEESTADGAWQECFAGKVSPGAATADRSGYFEHLERLLSIQGEPLQRAILDAVNPEASLHADGCLADGLLAAVTGAGASDPPAAATVSLTIDNEQRQQEMAALEAELAVDRDEYRKGQEYLAWIRKRWESDGKKPQAAGKPASAKGVAKNEASLERKRDELLEKLRAQGLPPQLPANLPSMFETAEGLRQELAALQLELTPLQRRKSTIILPGAAWPLLATLAGLAAAGAAYWQKLSWWLPLAGGCGALLLLAWGVFLVRRSRASAELNALEQELQAVEAKRAEALARQADLAEQFEAFGLPSTPVEMVKLQQLYRRNEELIGRYRDICAQLGGEVTGAAGAEMNKARDRHLQPDEFPEAEARLAEMAESLRQREARLAALRNGTATAASVASVPPGPSRWSEKQFLQAVGQHLERLTAGRHSEVRLDEERLRLEAAPGRWAAPAACSRGTSETLVLAIRLACCQMIGGALPLPIDDLPAHLDAKRRQAALRTLERFAVDHQLLLASCDEELARRAVRERWHVVKLTQPSTEQPARNEEADDAGQLHLL